MPNRLRLQCDVSLRSTIDVIRSASPKASNNSPLDVEFALLDNGAIKSPADYSSISIVLKRDNRRGQPFSEIAVSSADFNMTLTLAQWQAGTLYHGVAEFSENDLAVDMQMQTSKAFWMGVFGTESATGKEVFLGGSTINIEESGINLGGNVPTQGLSVITPGVYNGSGQYVVTVEADKYYTYAKGANDATIVNGSETYSANADFIAQGTSVTLTGTIGQPVTATLRNPTSLRPEQIIALVSGKIGNVMGPGQTITFRSLDGTKGVVVGYDEISGTQGQTPITIP